MITLHDLGRSSMSLASSIRLFFTFIGHFFSHLFKFMSRKIKIDWSMLFVTIYLSGARLMLPIIIISGILGFSLSVTLFSIFNELHLGRRALPIAQMAVIIHLAPLLIGVILSIQSALNLINAKVHQLHHTPNQVMSEHIIPIVFGVIITGLLLYIYCLAAFLGSIFATFHYALKIDVHYNLAHIATSISVHSLDLSIIKVAIYCVIISLIIGYYYYKIATRKISLRKAVSRIMTRNLLCIIFFNAYFNIFFV
jgi:ABC-type transporter Mla maintaining outer membrane lipid asymmetry permease subunit MlaE